MAVFARFGVNFYEIKFANKFQKLKIVWTICFHLILKVAKEIWQIYSEILSAFACAR